MVATAEVDVELELISRAGECVATLVASVDIAAVDILKTPFFFIWLKNAQRITSISNE
jgi:hypothetical protein